MDYPVNERHVNRDVRPRPRAVADDDARSTGTPIPWPEPLNQPNSNHLFLSVPNAGFGLLSE